MDPLNQRIIEIMNHLGLSKTSFANEIGVSQPVITHISTGRNKPGLDILQKILIKYPEVNAEWLITGKGSKIKERDPLKRELAGKLIQELETKVEATKTDLQSINSLLSIIKTHLT